MLRNTYGILCVYVVHMSYCSHTQFVYRRMLPTVHMHRQENNNNGDMLADVLRRRRKRSRSAISQDTVGISSANGMLPVWVGAANTQTDGSPRGPAKPKKPTLIKMIENGVASRQLVEWIVSHPDSMNATCGYHGTPLISVLKRANHYTTLQLLLQHGANPNAVPPKSDSLLYDKVYVLPLYIAVARQSMEDVVLLLEHGADPNLYPHHSPTQTYPRMGNILCHLFVNLRRTFHPGHIPAHADPAPFIDWFLVECNKRNKPIVLQQGPRNANGDRMTVLHAAVESGLMATVMILIKHGADVNAYDEGGFTALHRAAMLDKDDMVRLLVVVAGADMGLQTRNHYAAYASELGGPNAKRVLLELRHVAQRTHGMETPLYSEQQPQ